MFCYSTCPVPLSGMENVSLCTQGYLSLSSRQSRDTETWFVKKLIFLIQCGGQRFGCRWCTENKNLNYCSSHCVKEIFCFLHSPCSQPKQVVLGVFISLIALLQSDLCPHFTSGWRYWLPGWADHGSAHRNRGAAEESVCKAPGRGHGELVSPVLLLFTACNRILCISVSEGVFSPLLLVPLAILKCKPQVQSSGQLIWDHFAREREYPTTCGTLLSHWTVKPHLTRAQD